MQKGGSAGIEKDSQRNPVEQQMRLMAMMQAGVFRDEDFEDGDSQEEDEEEDYGDEIEQLHAQQLMAHASKLIA